MRKANAVATTIVIILLLILIGGIIGVIYSSVIPNEREDKEEDPEEILSKTFSIELLDNDTHTYRFQLHGNIDLDKDDRSYFLDFDDGTLPKVIDQMDFTYSYEEVDNNYPLLIERNQNGTDRLLFQTRLLYKFGEDDLNPIPVSPHERMVVDFDEQPIMFSGLGSFDIDGEVLGYYWDWGDGRHSDVNVGISGYRPSVVAAQDYDEPGTYIVSLHVMDNNFTRCEKPWTIEIIVLD